MAERAYTGAQITVTFDGARCLHAAECVRGLPTVFDTGRRPWIAPDGAPAPAVADVVARCPSGALSFARVDGAGEPVPAVTEVRTGPGEPVWLHGRVRVTTAAGVREDTRVALCRCGATANAPYCDASGDCTSWRGGH